MGRTKDEDGTPRRRRKRTYGTGSTYQDAAGQWWAQIRQDGKQRRFRAASEQAAKAKLKSLTEQKAGGVNIGTRATLHTYLDSWITNVVTPNKKPKTLAFYRQVCEDYIIPRIGTVRLDQLSADHIRAMLASLKADQFSPQTCKHAYVVIHTALQVAVGDRKLLYNPAGSVDPPSVPRQDVVALSSGEAAAILWATEAHRLHTLYALALTLGARKGELLGLTIQSVDLKAGTLTIAQQVQDLGGVPTILPFTKNNEVRTLPLTPRLVALVRRRMAQLMDERATAGDKWIEHGLLFPSDVGTPMSQRNLDRHWKATLKHAEMRDAKFHWMRHSVASWLNDCGITLETKAAILGHGAQGVTQGYVHVTLPTIRAAVETMERAVFGGDNSRMEATG